MYVSTGMSCTSTSCSLTSIHDTIEQNTMCTLVSVNGKGNPPRSGARMYLFNLQEEGKEGHIAVPHGEGSRNVGRQPTTPT